MLEQLGWFLPAFFKGLAVNFQLSLLALVGGLSLGLPLAFARLGSGWLARFCELLATVLRSAPIFVVMFFLLNVMPSNFSMASLPVTMTPWLAIVLALTIYLTAFVSDSGLDALRQLRAGSRVAAFLFFMNVVRGFFSTVLSSGFGAAVGVVEFVSVTLRAIESMPLVNDRLMLIGVVILLLMACFRLIYLMINLLGNQVTRRYAKT